MRSLLASLALALWATTAVASQSYDYVTAFSAFAKSRNPWMTDIARQRLGLLNWSIAGGNWTVARRLAAVECHESGNFKLAAWMDYENLPNEKLWPRYDCMGSHIRLICQEARRLGILTSSSNSPYNDDVEAVLEVFLHDPALGTWVVAHAYVRRARKVGVDRASHWWQTGDDAFPSKKAMLEDQYLQNIWRNEANFDRFVSGRRQDGTPTKSRRKK